MRTAMTMLLTLFSLLCLAGPAPAKGYGQYPWGSTLRAVRKVAPPMRRAYTAEHVLTESAERQRIGTAERSTAKVQGRKALKAWRKVGPPKARITAWKYKVRLLGLRTYVELRFIDKRLYGAVVRILYKAKQRAAVADVLDLLLERYGPPAPDSGPVGARPKLSFSTGDGGLVVLREAATRKHRGLVRLEYTATEMGGIFARYMKGLEARRREGELMTSAQAKAARRRRLEKKKRRLFKHL